jgi:hypothetical protein
MICAIRLPGGAEALARWPADDQVHRGGSDQDFKLFRGERGEISFENMVDVFEIGLEYPDSLMIEVDGGQAFEPGTLETEAESAAAAEKVNKGEGHRHDGSEICLAS